jgi:hypothetical protein
MGCRSDYVGGTSVVSVGQTPETTVASVAGDADPKPRAGLGTVEAPDEQAAKQAAAERYGLTEHQLARLALGEMR